MRLTSTRSWARTFSRLYYESRLAKLSLDESEKPSIDPDFEEATEGEEVDWKEKLKTKWAQLEAVVGAEHGLAPVAVHADLAEPSKPRPDVPGGP